MGYEDKSFFPAQILTDRGSRFHIQMVGRFVNEQKMIFLCKKQCEQYLCLFPMTQCLKGPEQHLGIHPDQIQLPADFPEFTGRIQRLQHFFRIPAFIFYLKGKIIKYRIGDDFPLTGHFPHKQF